MTSNGRVPRPAVERQHPKKGQQGESHTCKCGEREGGGGGRDMGWNVTWEGSKYAYTSTLYGTTHDLPVKYKVIVQ